MSLEFYDQQNLQYGRSSPKRNGSVHNDYEFLLDLSVKYNTVPGQFIHVIGSIPELGSWKNDQICKMQWTEGHVWRTIQPIRTK
jgi:hypothetical protein